MDCDVVVCFVGDIDDDGVSFVSFDGRSGKLSVHREDLLCSTEASVGSFFDLRRERS